MTEHKGEKTVWMLRAPDQKSMGFVRLHKKSVELTMFIQCLGLPRTERYKAYLYDGANIHSCGDLGYLRGTWEQQHMLRIPPSAALDDMAVAVVDGYGVSVLWGSNAHLKEAESIRKNLLRKAREELQIPPSELRPPETIFEPPPRPKPQPVAQPRPEQPVPATPPSSPFIHHVAVKPEDASAAKPVFAPAKSPAPRSLAPSSADEASGAGASPSTDHSPPPTLEPSVHAQLAPEFPPEAPMEAEPSTLPEDVLEPLPEELKAALQANAEASETPEPSLQAGRDLMSIKNSGAIRKGDIQLKPGSIGRKTPCDPFPGEWPGSRWVRVDYPIKGQLHHYLIGEIMKDGVLAETCCAVPGKWQPQIPEHLKGFSRYKDAPGMGGRGYYLMFRTV